MDRIRQLDSFLDLLRCPESGAHLSWRDGELASSSGETTYKVTPNGICLFAEKFCSDAARSQQKHYDRIASIYLKNIAYPHTQEYMAYLDRELLAVVNESALGTVAEVCCGRGEAIELLKGKMQRAVGVDISSAMLEGAQLTHSEEKFLFVQGDATMLPLANGAFDSVFMLGGIHHVANREKLFSEVARILKPGGYFYFREPVSDFILWRAIRAVIYRISPALDHKTERPLIYEETEPFLTRTDLTLRAWRTHGFVGFCLFMNSDVLVFNRLFRFIPGIRALTRLSTRFDAWCISLPYFSRAGLQVVGVAQKPP
jgi:ubiquinone/menaquinone biosynthesis C-methylase UbiE